MKVIKFRIYDPLNKKMLESGATPTMLASFFRATAVLNVRDNMEYQQFTGLLDKSGKEICEGDIVKGSYNEFYDFGHWKVILDKEKAAFYLNCIAMHHIETGFKDLSKGGYSNTYLHNKVVEIIGNIYEDELLDKEDKG